MGISKKMQDSINKQINAELWSSYLYLSMAAYFESKGLKGFANWMQIQVQEENFHAMKFFDFVNERGGRVLLDKIEKVPTTWKSPLYVFEETLKHEKKVTSLINNLVDIAIKENDHATRSFLNWYVDEQVEEEASADEIVQKLKLMGDMPGAMYMLDQELGKRTYNPPATGE